MQLSRNLGYAARFVSGYLIQLASDIRPLDGPHGPTADFTDLHAWAEIYLPGAGWIGLDATSGLLAGEGHIPLAASPDPTSAAPISGLVEKCETEFGFDMTIQRIRETPRVTKPYSEAQWRAILDTGVRVDRALDRADTRLTMGGEPTFVSATDLDAPEWNTEATGPTKRLHADRLLRRLQTRWTKGAALQHVMGKQYPGEQLPRWAFHCLWRADGEPVWRDPALLAAEDAAGDATPADAANFAGRLAERLQVDPALVIRAHEDTHYYLWREQRLPANVRAEDAKLADPLERDRLAKVFGQGPHIAVGSVLPLRRAIEAGARRWQSGRWFFRAGEMFLIPGDSPIGLRLPLDSIPWADPETIDPNIAPDPFAPRPPLPPHQSFLRRPPREERQNGGGIAGFRPVAQELPVIGRGEPDAVRTALAIEPRDGKLHIFLPPLFALEDWLDLLAAIEDTAAEAHRPVVLEGYLPPEDDRLTRFSVTPDPGVIEVNVHPVKSWPEQVQQTEDLYEEARLCGLATEKFDIDGRHVGTGGGNHVVMGGARSEDSPFLRRPDLLKSFLGFWHNHPSLSFLFSGQFIGPTSQHPRIDEARQDSLAELEIAFSQIHPCPSTTPKSNSAPPWNPGTYWARKPPRPAPFVTWTAPLNACRPASPAGSRNVSCSPATAAPCR